MEKTHSSANATQLGVLRFIGALRLLTWLVFAIFLLEWNTSSAIAQVSVQGLSAEQAVAKMKVPEGFAVSVVAAEPLVQQPVAIEFDDRGRL